MMYNIDEMKSRFLAICDMLEEANIKEFLNDCCGHTMRAFKERYYEQHLDEKVFISNGCSRAVFILPELDYVFKIQYDDFEFGNYCEAEARVFDRAQEESVEEFFAWTCFVGNFGQAAVYAMEKVEANEDRISDDSYRYHVEQWMEDCGYTAEDEMESQYCGDYDDHDGMIEFAIAHNGRRMAHAVDKVIDELGINDLHFGNWGYRGDTLVLIDYGGYGTRLFQE